LRIRVEVDGAGADLPSQITVQIRTQEPNLRRIGKSSMMNAYRAALVRQGNTSTYTGSVALSNLTTFMQGDQMLEVATVVREQGTSDGKFRKRLQSKWAIRGAAVVPDKGKGAITGGVKNDQPDA
jgi:hypothetical protein